MFARETAIRVGISAKQDINVSKQAMAKECPGARARLTARTTYVTIQNKSYLVL
jgi:hypothetical protein